MSENKNDVSEDTYEQARRNITLLAKLRTERRWPEKVVANVSAANLDGFIYQNVVASRLVMGLKEQGVGLLVIRDFDTESTMARDAITSVNLPFHSELRVACPPDGLFPLDWFDEGHGAPVMSEDPEWQEGRWVASELLLMPQMLDLDAATAEGFGALGPLFWLPKSMWQRAKEALLSLGVAQDRWFAVLDLESDDLAQRAIEVVRENGGQTLLLSQAISKHHEEEGIVILPQENEAFEVRMAAIALARFFVGRDHYYTTLASAFTTPCAMVEGANFERRIWNKGDWVCRTKCTAEELGKLIAAQIENSTLRTLEKAPEITVQRGSLEAIPLVWPKADPVVGFWA